MKYIYKITSAVVMLLSVTACQLTEIDDIDPKYSISSEGAFSSYENAETALIGIYNKGLLNSYALYGNCVQHGQMGIEINFAFSPNQYMLNDVQPQTMQETAYSEPYDAINAINYFIKGVNGMDSASFEGNRMEEMLGEAHFLRAQQYLNLLRTFGQFWDVNSVYGVVVHTEPNEELVIKERSTVQETYDLILSDLDFAITNAPDFATAIFASKQAAKAFKAKVLLYTQDYAGTVKLCNEVLSSGHFTFESSYGDVFTNTFESSESILVNHWDEKLTSKGGFIFGFMNVANPVYNALMPQDDPRRPFVLLDGFFGTDIIKYQDSEATFYMRLPEIYLMKAEAIVRSGGTLSDAQAALDAVRNRVGLASTNAPDAAQLLEDIRIEKLLELGFEDAQPWYDLVRYDRLGDLDINTIKSTITSENQLILPIPQISRDLSDEKVDQNPGY